MPRIIPVAAWKRGVEDGQREPQHRRQLVVLGDVGYRGAPRGVGNKDEDGEQEKGEEQESSSRRRSRSPSGQRRSESSRGCRSSARRHAAGTGGVALHAPRPLPPPPTAAAATV